MTIRTETCVDSSVFIIGRIERSASEDHEHGLLTRLGVHDDGFRSLVKTVRASPTHLPLDNTRPGGLTQAQSRLLDITIACGVRELNATCPLQPGEQETAPIWSGLLSQDIEDIANDLSAMNGWRIERHLPACEAHGQGTGRQCQNRKNAACRSHRRVLGRPDLGDSSGNKRYVGYTSDSDGRIQSYVSRCRAAMDQHVTTVVHELDAKLQPLVDAANTFNRIPSPPPLS